MVNLIVGGCVAGYLGSGSSFSENTAASTLSVHLCSSLTIFAQRNLMYSILSNLLYYILVNHRVHMRLRAALLPSNEISQTRSCSSNS